MDISKKIDEIKFELQNTITEMNSLKNQIAQLNKKGEQLAQKGNILKGKLEAYEEMQSQ